MCKNISLSLVRSYLKVKLKRFAAYAWLQVQRYSPGSDLVIETSDFSPFRNAAWSFGMQGWFTTSILQPTVPIHYTIGEKKFVVGPSLPRSSHLDAHSYSMTQFPPLLNEIAHSTKQWSKALLIYDLDDDTHVVFDCTTFFRQCAGQDGNLASWSCCTLYPYLVRTLATDQLQRWKQMWNLHKITHCKLYMLNANTSTTFSLDHCA